MAARPCVMISGEGEMNYEPRAEFLYYEPGAEKLKVSIRQELLSELRELRRKHAFQMSSLKT